MARRLASALGRSVFLFLLSMLLVFGFWEHRNFYQLGLVNLLIVGGFVTFLVIMAARLAFTGELPRGRPRGELSFSLEEGDRVLRQAIELSLRPAEADGLPVVGQVVWATYETGRTFGRLLVVDASRKFLSDITEDEARLAGYRSAAELREAAASRWGWAPQDVVALLRIRPLGVRA